MDPVILPLLGIAIVGLYMATKQLLNAPTKVALQGEFGNTVQQLPGRKKRNPKNDVQEKALRVGSSRGSMGPHDNYTQDDIRFTSAVLQKKNPDGTDSYTEVLDDDGNLIKI